MSTYTSRGSHNSTATNNNGGLDNSLKSNLVRSAEDALNTLLNLLFEKADEGIADMANNDDTDQIEKTYLDTMSILRLNMAVIKKHFYDAFLQDFKAFANKDILHNDNTPVKNTTESSLELIDEQVMDETMIHNNMADKQMSNCQQNLHYLSARMQVLYGYTTLKADQLPVSPHSIVNTFSSAMKKVEIEYEIRKIIYALFNKFVMSKLFTVYTKMNTLLISNNILPEINFAIIRAAETGQTSLRHNSRPTPAQMQDENFDWDTVDNMTYARTNTAFVPGNMNSQNKIQQNIHANAHGSGSGLLPQHNIIPTLVNMQTTLVNDNNINNVSPLEIGNRIIATIRQNDYSSINDDPTVDEEIILTISEIFNFLVEDNDIPKQIKGTLAKLQIPYLKAALTDNGLLQNEKHPARVLINNITQASIAWDYSRVKSDIFSKIETTVNELIKHYENDPKIFERLSNDFSAYWKHHVEINKAYEERSWKTTEGKERIEYANKRVDAWIHMWCMREDTRTQVKTFLKHFWKNTLLFFLHKYGEDSRQWTYNIKLINCLIWSTIPGKTAEETKQLIQVLPVLIRGLNRGLLATATHPGSIAKVFQTFSKCHLEIIECGLSGKSPGILPITSPTKIASLESIDQAYTQEQEDKSISDTGDQQELDNITPVLVSNDAPAEERQEEPSMQDEFSLMAETLEYGDWLEFTAEDENKIKAKFVWASSLTNSRLFVKPDGTRYALITLEDIATDMRNGKTKIIDSTPLFDKALKSATG